MININFRVSILADSNTEYDGRVPHRLENLMFVGTHIEGISHFQCILLASFLIVSSE